MSQRTSLYLGSIAALFWSVCMILFYVSGRMPTYLVGRGPFQTQALIAGIGIAIVALFVMLTANEKEADCGHDHGGSDDDGHDHDHDHGCDHGCGHDHGHHDPEHGTTKPHHHHEQETPFGLAIMLLILVVPVAAATALTPDQYSEGWIAKNGAFSNDLSTARKPTQSQDLAARVAKAAANKPPQAKAETDEPADASAAYASFTLDDLKAQVDQNANGELMITVPELFYTGGDKVIQDVLAGQGVETIGQVMAEMVNDNGRRLRIFRVFMECCAADKRPLGIPIEFADALPEYKEMGWYKVTGKMSYRQEGQLTVPVLEAETFTVTEEPEESIMY